MIRPLRAIASVALLATPVALSSQQIVSPQPAAAQQADDGGRTLLPMKVARSIGFRSIGPAVSGGRVSAVVGVQGNSATYYVGTADGGVFRTVNGGITWTPEFQHQHQLSIGALAVDPANPEIVWAGTGEGNVRNNVSFGDGMYKSTDGGEHWTHVGLDATLQIPRIAVAPNNGNTVFVAAMGNPWKDDPERGVFRTQDGGKTWEKVLYIAPDVGAADVAIDPVNPQVLYAATYRFRRTPWSFADGGTENAIYKSIDGGSSWTRLVGHGLPTTPVSRIGLAIAPSQHNRVYAAIGSSEGVIWRSDDAGANWTMVSNDQEADVRSFYFSGMAVDPTNPEHVFSFSMFLMDSHDGGQHFTPIATKNHVDNHAMWIDPSGSGRIIEGNDGGVILSRDNGLKWQFVNNIAIGQFYHVVADNEYPYLVCGGLQDNSAWCGPGWSQDPTGVLNRDWFALNGGDGIYAIPAADKPNLIYNGTQNGYLMTYDRTTRQIHDMEPFPYDFGGDGVAKVKYRQDWDAGFAVSPQNAATLYAGANVVFKSTDRGRSWKAISPDLTLDDKSKQGSSGGDVMKDNSGAEVYDAILIVEPSPSDANVLWVGTNDGQVQVTRDGGAHWTNVSSHIPNLPAWGRVESVKVSATNPGAVVIAVDRHFSGDFKPYLYATSDYGATWRSLAGNLPGDAYARSVMHDPNNAHMYYAGLENGLYTSWDDGAHWYLMGLGLPNVSIYDMFIQPQRNDLVLATHGRSVWVLDDLTPFEEYTPEIGRAPLHLFAVPDAYRAAQWSEVEPLGDGAFYGDNTTYGAMITYTLADSAATPGKLVIADASGKVVRTMDGMRELGPTESAPDETVPTGEAHPPLPKPDTVKHGGEAPWVPANAGMHRIYWDLRADGPVRWFATKDFNKGPMSGALIPPGTYTATLTVNGHSESQKIQVLADPRSHATPAEVQAEYAFMSAEVSQMSQLDGVLNRLDAMRAQANALAQVVKGGPNAAAFAAARVKLDVAMDSVLGAITSSPQAVESTVRYPDVIREHLQILIGGIEGGDQAPTPAQADQKTLLDPEFRAAMTQFDAFTRDGLRKFNAAMANLGLTGLATGLVIVP
jgi:photosystem II stability/assembly factor-like uncharacterized protein